MDEKKFSLPSVAGMQKQIDELQRLAMKDELSGLMNRDTLERRIKERLANMMPEETCALFIVDLDDFKRVNDTLGHQAGDQAIRQTGRVLSGMFRAVWGAMSSQYSSAATSQKSWCAPRPQRSVQNCSWYWGTGRPLTSLPA